MAVFNRLALLLLAIATVGVNACTPIYPGCTCKTANLTCAQLETISQNISNAFYAQYTTYTAQQMKVSYKILLTFF